MPYAIQKSGDRYCVVKEGRTMKCYPDRAAALAYLRALYANAKDA